MMKTILAGALALAVAVPATAQTPTRVVRYDDLNLESPAGVARLAQRIDAASRAVCAPTSGRQGVPGEASRVRACVAKAKAAAERQIAALEQDTALGG